MTALHVPDTKALARIRAWLRPAEHDDERLVANIVTIHRAGAQVGQIACANDLLAWDAYRICAGARFRRKNEIESAELIGHAAVADLAAFAAG